MECGLTWKVPLKRCAIHRDAKIELIKKKICKDMANVSGIPYRNLLELLQNHTQSGWRHQFLTTNWDYLLQKEIGLLKLKVLPKWLRDSHVSHMNGTAEVLPDNTNRSFFLLEDDPPSQRSWSAEANIAYNKMIWGNYFVVIGVSFECDTDRFLLKALGDVSDVLPVGESHWIVLNPDDVALNKVVNAIQSRLPSASIYAVKNKFGKWLAEKMPELHRLGVIAC
jgi:hypothetical protein